MQIRLYLDEDAQRNSLVLALRERGVDVKTANEADLINVPDEKHLEYAAMMGVFFTPLIYVIITFSTLPIWITTKLTRELSWLSNNVLAQASNYEDCYE